MEGVRCPEVFSSRNRELFGTVDEKPRTIIFVKFGKRVFGFFFFVKNK